MYKYIVNPLTGKKLIANSKKGHYILEKYISQFGGALNELEQIQYSYLFPKNNLTINQEFSNKLFPEVFIIGYGSLINTKSRIRTGNDTIGNAIPVNIKSNAGLKRVWNFQKPDVAHLTVLGLQHASNSTVETHVGDNIYIHGNGEEINGVMYPIYDNIDAFDKREEGYYRLKLARTQVEALSWQKLPEYNCEIYVYIIPKENQLQRATFELPILQSYIDIVINGCLEYGEEFARKFIQTTYGWNNYWLNDRSIPRRPWIHEKNFRKIDTLLKEELREKYTIKLPVDYDPLNSLEELQPLESDVRQGNLLNVRDFQKEDLNKYYYE